MILGHNEIVKMLKLGCNGSNVKCFLPRDTYSNTTNYRKRKKKSDRDLFHIKKFMIKAKKGKTLHKPFIKLFLIH